METPRLCDVKVVVDQAIPFIKGVLEPYVHVVYKEGKSICREDLSDAQAIVIRTRTACDASLLEGTAVKMISTATIGTDHVDIPWCDSHGILVRNAPGCNAGGVMEYVFSALYGLAARRSINLSGKNLGIIGVGHVGGRVNHMAKQLGFRTLLCDPPRAEREGPFGFVDLDTLLRESDIVTLHVPLNPTTSRLANAEFFRKMKKGAFFINSSRGEVMVDADLKKAIGYLGPVVIDTWNGEPDIDQELLEMVDIGTPHIAGYSYQGKQNGTAAAVRAIAHFFGISELYEFYPPTEYPENEAVKLDLRGKSQGEIAAALQYNYPVFTDDFLLRMSPGDFERLRSEYRYRREVYVD